jgi:hypothetical protein
MTEPKNVDWDKVHTLLNTANLARQWPKLKHLEDLALAELEGLGKTPAEPAQKPQPTQPQGKF